MKKIFSCIIIIMISLCGAFAYAATLNVSVKNQDGTSASTVTFPGTGSLVLGGNLWLVSPQYIRIIYSSPETYWSIRIVTKNNVHIGGVSPKPYATGPDNEWEWNIDSWPENFYHQDASGVWQTGDDMVTYAGLINPASKGDPNSRAPLAWQVFRYNDPYNPPPPDMTITPPTSLNDTTVGGGPIDDWAYLADAGDTGYIADPTHDYFWVAYGSGGFSLLAQHPVVYTNASGDPLPKPGGGDIILYIGARFGLKAPDGVTDVAVLPAGDYGSLLYVELIHW